MASEPVIANNFDGGIFSVNHYRRYFNLNTSDFFHNIVKSVNIIKNEDDDNELGDLYGPIWVSATIIFILFFSNTSSNLIYGWFNGVENKYQYDFKLLTGAMSLIYGYTFLIPLGFYLISTFYFKLSNFLKLTKIISIYGYSNSIWLPSAILNILRSFLQNHLILNSILKWLNVLIAGLISGFIIIKQIYPTLKNSCLVLENEKLSYILIGTLILCHMGFIIAVKVLFYGDMNVV